MDKKVDMNRTNLMEQKWDVLIILDGCRYDTFKEVNTIPGELEKIYSMGSATGDWVKNSFADKKKYEDVVYISGCPLISEEWLKKLVGFVPFRVIEVFRSDWDMELQTILPDKLNKSFLDNYDKDPGKKYVVHYFQPHHPFVGKKCIKATGATQWYTGKVLGKTVWKLIEDGELSVEAAYEAYKSNLEFVLIYVKELLPKIHGKIVITSDHGNLFGEYGITYYGLKHSPDQTYPEVREVPWFIVKGDSK